MDLTPEARAVIDKIAVGRTFADDGQRVQWMVESVHRRMSFAQESRLFAALGITKPVPSPDEIVAAAEGQKRQLEQQTTEQRSFEAKSRELEQVRAEVEGLRQDLASRERLNNARRRVEQEDAAEEAAERARIAAFMHVDPSRVL